MVYLCEHSHQTSMQVDRVFFTASLAHGMYDSEYHVIAND